MQQQYPAQNSSISQLQSIQKMTPSNSIHIGDIDTAIGENELFQFFNINKFQVKAIIIKRDGFSKSKGFGFIEFNTQEESERAIKELDGKQLGNKALRISAYVNTKELDPEADVFLQNLDTDITTKELKDFFSQFGNVCSTKISTDPNGAPLGYGYVQFSSKEDALKALKTDNYIIKKNQVQIVKFVPRKSRDTQTKEKKTLYVKNISEKFDLNTIDDKIKTEFGQFGNIVNKSIHKDEKQSNKYFAYITFETEDSAQQALKNLNEKDLFGNNENIIVQIVIKDTRFTQEEKEEQKNIYVKNIAEDIKLEQVKEAFRKYGQIKNITVQKSKDLTIKTQFACVFFESGESVNKVIGSYKYDKVIQELSSNGQIYVTYFQNKHERQSFLNSKVQGSGQYPSQQQMLAQQMYFMNPMNPMFFMQQQQQYNPYINPYFNQFQPPMMQGYNPYMGQPQQFQQRQQSLPQQQFRNNFAPRGGYNRNNNRGQYNNFNNNQYYNRNNNGGTRRQFNDQQIKTNPQQQQQQQQQQGQQQQYYDNQPLIQNPQQYQQPQLQQNIPAKQMSDAELSRLQEKFNLATTLAEADKQKEFTEIRDFFGKYLYPEVQKILSEQNLNDKTAKITGMIVDFTNFSIEEIIDMIRNPSALNDNVNACLDSLQQSQQETQ